MIHRPSSGKRADCGSRHDRRTAGKPLAPTLLTRRQIAARGKARGRRRLSLSLSQLYPVFPPLLFAASGLRRSRVP